MGKSKSFRHLSARERISSVVETWFLTEPLLFTAWMMHDVTECATVQMIRVSHGRIDFNPEFVASLTRDELRQVLTFEATRILLGHPYSRRQPDPELSYSASNLTVQECLRTRLPMPRARDVFGDSSYDDQYFEYYYRELAERTDDSESSPSSEADSGPDADPDSGLSDDAIPDEAGSDPIEDQTVGGEASGEDETEGSGGDQRGATRESNADSESQLQSDRSDAKRQADLDAYADPTQVGLENAGDWDADELRKDEIESALREAAEANGWGTIGGHAKEQLLATLHPKLDYRGVLRGFRQSVLSVRRRLTRMKPSRRYGFAQMGSRYDFTTKLLFAVDVSGSMGTRDLQLGFSIVSRFFRYGVESIDVVWFDDQIRCKPMTLRRARHQFEITGRGGTNFEPVIELIDQRSDYDGLIIFTDGYAPVPRRPQNSKTRILWLFKDESTYEQMHTALGDLGRTAYLRPSAVHA